MKRIVMLVAAMCLVGVGGTAWAVDGGSGLGANGAHNGTGSQGTCSKCHIPHGGKGDKIWARALTTVTSFSGVHQLCDSCHYNGNGAGITSGANSVFLKGAYQNHSMLAWAAVTGGAATIPTGAGNTFPLNTLDADTIWTVTSPDTGDSNGGFYCGSCHNPHKQPWTVINGHGDYLRAGAGVASFAAFGSSMARSGACTQCHPGQSFSGTQVSSGHNASCSVCHNPHRGGDVATAANALIAEKILVVSGTTSPFVALPNVPGFTAGSYAELMAGICFNCHAAIGAGRMPAGSTKVIYTSLEHHPMGTNAPGADGTDHAPGYTTSGFAGAEMTCPTCHDPHTGGQDFYLRSAAGTYTGTATDDGDFCVTICHTDKFVTTLSAAGVGGHLETKATSTITVAADEGGTGQGECYMCHFIHDGVSRGAATIPELSSLMRMPAVNMARVRQIADTDTLDYEDLCNGCHSISARVRGTILGTGGAYLTYTAATVTHFSHLFSGTATGPVTTAGTVMANMSAAGLLMAPADKVQYGAVSGELYCGTCHNVHVQNTTDTQGGMFRKEHWGASGKGTLCTDCHGVQPIYQGTAGGGSHPIRTNALLPTTGVTAATTATSYGNGGMGAPGGRTTSGTPGTGPAASDSMECETCHNFHTSVTNRNGASGAAAGDSVGTNGKLMIMVNGASQLCSTCHTSY